MEKYTIVCLKINRLALPLYFIRIAFMVKYELESREVYGFETTFD